VSISTFIDGVVIDTSDPQQMGRVKVWCPALDGETYDARDLPWADYVSPFAGQTIDYPAGSGAQAPGPVSYGFWAVPKVGATAVVGFLYGDINRRFYLGSFYPEHGNRSLPAGRNSETGPTSDTGEAIEPAKSSLNAQFQGNFSSPEAQTRGAYERQVAQPRTDKDGAEGYQKGVKESGLDPQTYCITTPGRHVIVMQDNPETARVRIKTSNGHQVILDDANERIYISTAKGQSWVEMDQDGRIHIYAGDSISIATGGDFNLAAKGSINLQAGGNLNLAASGWGRLSACSDVSLSGDGGINLTSGGAMDFLASGLLTATGSAIHLNGPGAATAPCADKVEDRDIPQHEPWERKGSKAKRGKNWRA
jgi:Type VI secretion system/phage-baseplate injector OB domain